MLRSAKDQAFYGAPLTRFPPLGEGYVRWALERHGLLDAPDLPGAVELFGRCGHEPEILNAALGEIAYGAEPGDADARLETAVDALLREADLVRLRQVLALPALQGAVLHEMASAGDVYAPFHTRTRERYARRMSGSADVPGESSVQSALTALQRKGRVWRASTFIITAARTRCIRRPRCATGPCRTHPFRHTKRVRPSRSALRTRIQAVEGDEPSQYPPEAHRPPLLALSGRRIWVSPVEPRNPVRRRTMRSAAH